MRDTLDVDVLIVGAGPAGLAAAISLGRLAKAAGKTLSIMLIEKAREIGAHGISGAVLDERSLRELFPTYEADGCPIEGRVTDNQLWYLTETDSVAAPFIPSFYLAFLMTSGVAWIAAFSLFVLWYGPMLLTARVEMGRKV